VNRSHPEQNATARDGRGQRAAGPRRSPSRCGASLVELIIVVTVLLFVVAAVGYVMLASSTTMQVGTAYGVLQSRLADAVDRITAELRQSGPDCPDWSLATSSLTCRVCTGFDGVERLWGEPVTYSLSADGDLLRTQDGSSIVLLKRVTTLSFEQKDALVLLTVAAEQPTKDQKVLSASMSTTVFLNDS